MYVFFFNDTATTEIYTLSLHDALPIFETAISLLREATALDTGFAMAYRKLGDRKSTRLNSSHSQISYAVFCLKKKKNIKIPIYITTIVTLHTIVIHNMITTSDHTYTRQ